MKDHRSNGEYLRGALGSVCVTDFLDPELLRGLQGPLAPYQALADRTVVHRAILAQSFV